MPYLAIDIGGTNIKVGLISSEGHVSETYEVPTPQSSFEALKDVLFGIVDRSKAFEIDGIGISQPCGTDPVTGACLSEGALGYIIHNNIRQVLAEYTGLPTVADNDGNCAAIAELWLGGCRQVKDFVFVVCGTGIGGAVIKNREIHMGANLFSGEFGMMINQYDVETDTYTIWSHTGSTQAVVKAYATAKGIPETSINGKWVFDQEHMGDPVAVRCVKHFYAHFAVGLLNIQHMYDPEKILIGGAITMRPDFIVRLQQALQSICPSFSTSYHMPKVETTGLGPQANLLGAIYPLLKL